MVSPATLTQAQSLREWAESVMRDWQLGQAPDTSACLRQRPDLAGAKSVLVELAYEEYRLRRQRGEALDAQAYCAQFSKCRYELRRMLSVHRALIEENPSWLASFETGFGGDFAGEFGNVDAWPTLGEEWLGYQIIEELGRGGLARVYLAAETEAAGRHVVLKVSARETDEAQHLAPLSHANIIPVLTVRRDEHSGMSAIVMPFLGRTTLYDVLDATYGANEPPSNGQVFAQVANRRLQQGDMPQFSTVPDTRDEPKRGPRQDSYLDSLIRLGMELAEALAHTHGRGVLHRDLKPSNVLITPSGRPLLMDFNLATAEDESALWGGTIPYMPAELLLAVAGGGAADYEHEIGTSFAQSSSFLTPSSQGRPAGDCDLSTVRAHRTHPDPAHDHPSRANWQATADVRSDLFSLGAILYELYTGELPYGQPDLKLPVESQAQSMIRRQAKRLVRFPANSSRRAKAFERILQSCLSAEPKARPKNARQLADQLAALLPERRTWRAKAAAGVTLIVACFLFTAIGMHKGEGAIPKVDEWNRSEVMKPNLDEDQIAIAMRQIENLLAANPRDGEAWAWYCYYCNIKCQHLEALIAADEAIRSGHETASVRNNRALAWRRMRKNDEAIEDAKSAIALQPNVPQPYLNRAIASVGKLQAAFSKEKGLTESSIDLATSAILDANKSVTLAGESPVSCLNAAWVCHETYLITNDDKHLTLARTYKDRAVSLGASADQVRALSGLQEYIRDESGLAKPQFLVDGKVAFSDASALMIPE